MTAEYIVANIRVNSQFNKIAKGKNQHKRQGGTTHRRHKLHDSASPDASFPPGGWVGNNKNARHTETERSHKEEGLPGDRLRSAIPQVSSN